MFGYWLYLSPREFVVLAGRKATISTPASAKRFIAANSGLNERYENILPPAPNRVVEKIAKPVKIIILRIFVIYIASYNKHYAKHPPKNQLFISAIFHADNVSMKMDEFRHLLRTPKSTTLYLVAYRIVRDVTLAADFL